MRPSLQDTMFKVLESIGERSTCNRGHAGALVVRDGRIVATGWSGAPAGLAHCDEEGHSLDPQTGGCIRTIHAEQNAICYAAREGIATKDATMYCTMTPCHMCAKSIVAAGIKEVRCMYHYRDELRSTALFMQTKIKVTWLNDEVRDYPKGVLDAESGVPGSDH